MPCPTLKKVTVPLSEANDWDLFIREHSIIVQSTVNSHWESMIDLQLQVNRHSITPCMSSRTLAGKQTYIYMQTHAFVTKKEDTYWYRKWDQWISPLEKEGSPNLESRVLERPPQSLYHDYSPRLSGGRYLGDKSCDFRVMGHFCWSSFDNPHINCYK